LTAKVSARLIFLILIK